MAVPWNVSHAHVQRHYDCSCHLLHRHHLRSLSQGDLLRDQPGTQEVFHHIR